MASQCCVVLYLEKKGTTICDRRIVKFDIRTAQYDNGTIEFEKQINEPLNVKK